MGYSNKLAKLVHELEETEKDVSGMPLVFAEMLKNEINANDEHRIYNGIKRIVRKYAEDKNAIAIINEFTSVITGGATLVEIMTVAKDEAINPTLVSSISTDNT